MATAPSRWGERALLGSFSAVALAFFAANAYTQHAMARIDDASDDIASNSAPSIVHLAAVRTLVRHAEFLVGTALTRGGNDRAGIDATIAQLDDEANAYLALPTFPGEKSFWGELNESIRAFDGAIQRVLAQRDAGAGRDARATLDDDVVAMADRVSSAAAAALEFNARNGRELALRIKTERRSAEWVGYALTTFLALVTLLAGIVVRTLVRRQRALAEEHAALQERRAAELETFAGRAAHDILNPVSATQLALALASKRRISDERVRELVERGLRNLHRIRVVIDDLLQFARAGASPSPGASADVAAVLDDVVDGIRPTAEAAGVELRVEPVERCRASCSVGVLTSVISNLAQNATKYIGDAMPRRVTLRATHEAGYVRLEVEDSGPGIPPDILGEIFRPYVRGPTGGKEGLGLGLATVKRLCESHGGRVGVRSVVGRGSVFWVELPDVQDAARRPVAGGPAERTTGGTSLGR